MTLSFEAVGRAGGLAFTLNLSTKREKMLMCRADPADDLRRYISREMRKSFGRVLPYSFAFEISPTGKLHVHGAVIPRDGTTAHREALKEVFARAGGKITGRGAARQIVLESLTDGIGWAVYSQKAFDDACRYLGTYKVTFIAEEVLRMTKGLHSETQASIMH